MISSSSSSTSSTSSNESDYLLPSENLRIIKDRCYQERICEDYYTDDEFKKRFRFSKSSLNFLESLVAEDLQHVDNRGLPLSVKQKIMLTLRYYATGSFQIVLGDLLGISQSTACITVHEVSKAFARISKRFIKMPENADQRALNMQKFFLMNKIPRCLGCIDGCHIPIKSPGGPNAELFRNRKGFFSINVQAVCDSNCKFLDIVARWHGSAHDQTIFNFSSLKHRFENGEFGDGLLVGDGGYGCKEYLITPYRNPRNTQQTNYNKALSSTRVCIERAFGIWKRRFSVLAKNAQVKLKNYLTIVVATAVLHNIAIDLNDQLSDDEDLEELNVMPRVPANPLEVVVNTAVRDAICANF